MEKQLVTVSLALLVSSCGGPQYQVHNVNRVSTSAIYSVDEGECNLKARGSVHRKIAESKGGLGAGEAVVNQMRYDRQYETDLRSFSRDCMAAKGWVTERRLVTE